MALIFFFFLINYEKKVHMQKLVEILASLTSW